MTETSRSPQPKGKWREEWRREFARTPIIYWTECLGQPTGNFYDSMEAAVLEVNWNAAQKDSYHHPRVTVRYSHIHTLTLSQERWEGLTR